MNGGTPWLGTVAPTTRMTDARPRPSVTGWRRWTHARTRWRQSRRHGLDDEHGQHRQDHRDAPQRGRTGVREPRQELPERCEVGRPEQDPAEHHELQHDEPPHQHRDPREPPLADGVLGRQAGAVHRAPQHEGPRGAMPQPAEGHRDHEVHVGPRAPFRLPPSGM